MAPKKLSDVETVEELIEIQQGLGEERAKNEEKYKIAQLEVQHEIDKRQAKARFSGLSKAEREALVELAAEIEAEEPQEDEEN